MILQIILLLADAVFHSSCHNAQCSKILGSMFSLVFIFGVSSWWPLSLLQACLTITLIALFSFIPFKLNTLSKYYLLPVCCENKVILLINVLHRAWLCWFKNILACLVETIAMHIWFFLIWLVHFFWFLAFSWHYSNAFFWKSPLIFRQSSFFSSLYLKECVRRRVMKSVTANPYCSESAARDAMEAVWDVCYNDTKPFDRAP